MNKVLSVIIPAYNEENTIIPLLNNILNAGIKEVDLEINIVDDHSRDKTRDLIREFMKKDHGMQIRYFRQEKNMGKGAAIHRGIEECKGDLILIQDADLEYDPREYSTLLKPLLEERADVVYGSRFRGSNPHRVLFFWHSIGNGFLTSLSNMFTNLNLTDMETCYKLFRAKDLKRLYLKEKRFGFEPEVTAKIARIPGIRIFEVGISYYGRTYEEGKKINWKDGFRAIYCILKYNLFHRRTYKDPDEKKH